MEQLSLAHEHHGNLQGPLMVTITMIGSCESVQRKAEQRPATAAWAGTGWRLAVS